MPRFSGVVSRIVVQSPRVKLFRISLTQPMSFQPGQFVLLSFDDFKDANGNVVKRSYSIASSPLDEGFIELTIARQEPGFFSAKMHSISEGTQINVDGPFGTFTLGRPVAPGTVFISGGCGIGPIRSMLLTLFREGFSGELWFFFGFRSPEEFVCKEEILGWRLKYPNLKLKLSINSAVPGWTEDVGFISDVLPKYIPKGAGRDVYFCGPPMMVDATIKRLAELGFEDSRIHREKW